MTPTHTQEDAWAAFQREYGLDTVATPDCFAARGATLAPLRAEVSRISRGRPRKVPPVEVPEGSRYCFGCKEVLPITDFDARHDGLRLECRACERTARAARARQRRRHLALKRDGLLFPTSESSEHL